MQEFPYRLSSPSRILVVGDSMLDRYLVGQSSRLSPEAPVPVVLAQTEESRPGGAANVAASVAALGASCTLLTIVGKDRAADELTTLVESHGAQMIAIRNHNGRTTEKTRVLSGTQQIVRIDYDCVVDDPTRDNLAEKFKEIYSDYDVIIFSDYAKGCLAQLPDLIALAKTSNIPSLVDPKSYPPAHYRGAFLLKPNAKEFDQLFPGAEDRCLIEASQRALKEHDISHLVVTKGSEGITLISATGEVVHHPTQAKEVFDVSGAGDTVLATLAVAIGSGTDIPLAIDIANAAAGVAVARAGTHVVTRAELIEHLTARHISDTDKQLASEELAIWLNKRRASGQCVVFTNGCFDILHPGHVQLLAAAKAEGDLLVVGVNSDESVQRLKGQGRPINSAQNRMAILSALACVDFVVEFTEDTPLELIRTIKPDVLVKGGDYAIETIVGADDVIKRGGRVVTPLFLDGHSSTGIIERAKLDPGLLKSAPAVPLKK